MRKVTRNAAAAFLAGQDFRQGNTEVLHVHPAGSPACRCLFKLHGNTIAETLDGGRTLRLTLAGWPTPTTRERLNGLLDAWLGRPTFTGFFQRDHEQRFGWGIGPGAKFVDVPVADREWLTLDRAGNLLAREERS